MMSLRKIALCLIVLIVTHAVIASDDDDDDDDDDDEDETSPDEEETEETNGTSDSLNANRTFESSRIHSDGVTSADLSRQHIHHSTLGQVISHSDPQVIPSIYAHELSNTRAENTRFSSFETTSTGFDGFHVHHHVSSQRDILTNDHTQSSQINSVSTWRGLSEYDHSEHLADIQESVTKTSAPDGWISSATFYDTSAHENQHISFILVSPSSHVHEIRSSVAFLETNPEINSWKYPDSVSENHLRNTPGESTTVQIFTTRSHHDHVGEITFVATSTQIELLESSPRRWTSSNEGESVDNNSAEFSLPHSPEVGNSHSLARTTGEIEHQSFEHITSSQSTGENVHQRSDVHLLLSSTEQSIHPRLTQPASLEPSTTSTEHWIHRVVSPSELTVTRTETMSPDDSSQHLSFYSLNGDTSINSPTPESHLFTELYFASESHYTPESHLSHPLFSDISPAGVIPSRNDLPTVNESTVPVTLRECQDCESYGQQDTSTGLSSSLVPYSSLFPQELTFEPSTFNPISTHIAYASSGVIIESSLTTFIFSFYDDATEMSLPGTSLPGTSLPGTSLPGTSLPGTSLPGTSLPGTSLPGTSFLHTVFSQEVVTLASPTTTIDLLSLVGHGVHTTSRHGTVETQTPFVNITPHMTDAYTSSSRDTFNITQTRTPSRYDTTIPHTSSTNGTVDILDRHTIPSHHTAGVIKTDTILIHSTLLVTEAYSRSINDTSQTTEIYNPSINDTSQTTDVYLGSINDTSQTTETYSRSINDTSQTTETYSRSINDTSQTTETYTPPINDTSQTTEAYSRSINDTSETTDVIITSNFYIPSTSTTPEQIPHHSAHPKFTNASTVTSDHTQTPIYPSSTSLTSLILKSTDQYVTTHPPLSATPTTITTLRHHFSSIIQFSTASSPLILTTTQLTTSGLYQQSLLHSSYQNITHIHTPSSPLGHTASPTTTTLFIETSSTVYSDMILSSIYSPITTHTLTITTPTTHTLSIIIPTTHTLTITTPTIHNQTGTTTIAATATTTIPGALSDFDILMSFDGDCSQVAEKQFSGIFTAKILLFINKIPNFRSRTRIGVGSVQCNPNTFKLSFKNSDKHFVFRLLNNTFYCECCDCYSRSVRVHSMILNLTGYQEVLETPKLVVEDAITPSDITVIAVASCLCVILVIAGTIIFTREIYKKRNSKRFVSGRSSRTLLRAETVALTRIPAQSSDYTDTEMNEERCINEAFNSSIDDDFSTFSTENKTTFPSSEPSSPSSTKNGTQNDAAQNENKNGNFNPTVSESNGTSTNDSPGYGLIIGLMGYTKRLERQQKQQNHRNRKQSEENTQYAVPQRRFRASKPTSLPAVEEPMYPSDPQSGYSPVEASTVNESPVSPPRQLKTVPISKDVSNSSEKLLPGKGQLKQNAQNTRSKGGVDNPVFSEESANAEVVSNKVFRL